MATAHFNGWAEFLLGALLGLFDGPRESRIVVDRVVEEVVPRVFALVGAACKLAAAHQFWINGLRGDLRKFIGDRFEDGSLAFLAAISKKPEREGCDKKRDPNRARQDDERPGRELHNRRVFIERGFKPPGNPSREFPL
jgi:hypothetical protein